MAYSERTEAIIHDSLRYRARMLREAARYEVGRAHDEMIELARKTEYVLEAAQATQSDASNVKRTNNVAMPPRL